MSLSWFELHFPLELEADAVQHFTRLLAMRARRGLLMSADPVVVEARGVAGRLVWLLGLSSRDRRQVLSSLRQALPDVHTEPTHYTPIEAPAWELRLSSPRRSVRTDTSSEVAGALLSAVRSAGKNELVVLQWLIGPLLHRAVVPPVTASKQAKSQLFLEIDRPVLDAEQTKALRDKQAEPLFGVVGRIAIRAASRGRTRVLRQTVMGALQLVRAPGVGFERRLLPTFLVGSRVRRLARPKIAWPAVLNAAELAVCLGWPIGNPVLPGVTYGGHRHLPPPAGRLLPPRRATPKGVRVTGESTFPAQPGRLTLSARDGLHHVLCIGPTGTGKSTWLANLALQDIDAGRAVVVVDPKRDLVEAIADRIPAHRLNDVVLLDPTADTPVGFNVLNTDQPELAVDSLLHVLRELYSANWGPRTADVLHNSLLTLVRAKGMTLCELPPLLQNRDFRRQVVAQVKHDVLGVAPFWQAFESLSEPQRTEIVAPALNKLRPFVSRSNVRSVIGQARGFDLLDIFRKRTVLLVSLAKGDIGSESAHLLGSLLLGGFFTAVQRRSQVEPDKRHPAFVYLDEFADILRLPVSLADALATARGFGVGLVLAHQELKGQLTPEIRAAVLANARSKVVFQTGHDDAVVLAKVLGGGLTPNDLQGLRAYETYQALTVGGRTMSPASVLTLPLDRPLGTLGEIRRRSAERYGVKRAETDAVIRARRSGAAPADGPIGSRRRGGST